MDIAYIQGLHIPPRVLDPILNAYLVGERDIHIYSSILLKYLVSKLSNCVCSDLHRDSLLLHGGHLHHINLLFHRPILYGNHLELLVMGHCLQLFPPTSPCRAPTAPSGSNISNDLFELLNRQSNLMEQQITSYLMAKVRCLNKKVEQLNKKLDKVIEWMRLYRHMDVEPKMVLDKWLGNGDGDEEAAKGGDEESVEGGATG
ncbi:hypothetical protein Adt_42362 [Abeliophyllum distichum]|uniref:Uncharacterized protein n=1 Tax=Abeliophyllum distichum TaxID=126358 RepID=A0ABD1PVC6_9LAMI